MMNLLMKILY